MTGIEILHVVGARPNFMKLAPVHSALARRGNVRQRIIHTGQHYDANMSDVFFRELGIPEPDVNLGVGSGSHTQQTAQIMSRFESIVLENPPDLVVVYGDVNSTMAAALVCAKLSIPVAHVEAGLRSFDRTMPEEINRLLTDRLADLLFTPSSDGDENLIAEGVPAERIYRVGNVMIDTLVRSIPEAERSWENGRLSRWREVPYVLVTLHRPSNVDDERILARQIEALARVAEESAVLFPVHPRTRERLDQMNVRLDSRNMHLLDPLGYVQFLALQMRAKVVITDSGGVQEETTYLHVPCLTIRPNTERPVTVTMGTNRLVGDDMDLMIREARSALRGEWKTGAVPPLWDGHAGQRIAEVICSRFMRE